MIEKSDFITIIDSLYLFKSCGWLHEKDLIKFTYTHEPILKDIIPMKDKKLNQTTIFDYLN